MWQKLKNILHLFQAIGANIWYQFPANKLTIIGVTGTDGKTTTASLIYHIFYTSGAKVALVSTVSAIINGKSSSVGFHVTTPRFFALRSYMKKAAEVGAKYFVLEVTSHALDQNRIFGIPFEVGVLTNITHEHLDYHKTYEKYVEAKIRLLQNSEVIVVNRDDESYKMINSKFKIQNSKLLTYGMGKDADVNPEVFPFKTKMFGEFNKYNALAAIGACRALGISDEAIRKGLATFDAPIGREEIVYRRDFSVMIDFAHTPNAFKQLLSSLRTEVKGKIVHVFGAAGERDHAKRSKMGKISSQYADIIVLTAEDPRSESIDKINEEIESGIMNPASQRGEQESRVQIYKIPDRQEAINKAVKLAKKGDLVLLTGKAHEESMNYGKGEEPWNEFEAVNKALRLLSG